jgi:uncharacterized protein YgiM (DUF1202 family)
MKSKFYLVTLISALTASALIAQDNTAPQPAAPTAPSDAAATQPAAPTPAPTPAAPEAKPKAPTKKKKTTKTTKTAKTAKAPAASGSTNLVYNPPASATVKQEAINVRGQASFVGEVITHLHKGETVTVLEEITLKKPKKDEPAKWAKISMPTNTPVWVSGDFVDATSMTASKRLNVRGGPGENYSVVARLEKGTQIKELRKNKGWIEIETPNNAFGFVAADFLNIQPGVPAPTVAANTPTAPEPATPAPAPETATVKPDTTPVAANPNEQPTPTPPTNPGEAVANTLAPAAPAPEVSNEPPPKRVVTREGTVKKARNIQSPTDYELHDARTGEAIEYLMSATADKTLKPYLGMRVLVTGPEVLDARWKSMPIVEVESIELP